MTGRHRNKLRELAALLLRFSLLPWLVRKILCRHKVNIIVYHRPEPAVFKEHMEYLSRRFNFVSLEQALAAIGDKAVRRLPPRPLVVTFDDGHRSNHALLPLFQQFNVRPTIYLCSHIVNSNRHYWWRTGVTDPNYLKQMPYDRFLTCLKNRYGYEPETEYDDRIALNLPELQDLLPWVEFGSHTKFHPVLPQCPDEVSQEEIAASRSHLETLLGKQVRHFAFPNGDSIERDLRYVKAAAYASARTLTPGWNDDAADVYKLRVNEVEDDASIDVLCAQVSGIFPQLRHIRLKLQSWLRHPEVLMVGPYALGRTEGGISAVLANYRSAGLFFNGRVRYLATSTPANRFAKLLRLLITLTSFLLHLSRSSLQTIHIHTASWRSFYRKMLFVHLGVWFGKQVILHIHGGEFREFYRTANSVGRRIITRTLQAPALLLVVSESWQSTFAKLAPGQQIEVLHNPVAPEPVRQNEKTSTRANRGFTVVFLGRLTPEKGLDDLLAAMQKISDTTENIRLLVCGDGDIPKYQNICTSHGLANRVEFRGWIDTSSKWDILRTADLFVLPSYNEGSPVSILEAMAAGLPVLATAVGGIPDLIADPANGKLVTPGDVDALASALLALIRQPQMRQRMAQNNRSKVSQQHDTAIILAQLKRIYEGVRSSKEQEAQPVEAPVTSEVPSC